MSLNPYNPTLEKKNEDTKHETGGKIYIFKNLGVEMLKTLKILT